MSIFYAYQNRGITKDITVLDADGVAVPMSTGDLLRVIIGREGQLGSEDEDYPDAELVVSSEEETAGGSSITIDGGADGSHRLRLDSTDLGFAAGVYTMLVEFYDHADSGGEWKNVSRQVFVLEET